MGRSPLVQFLFSLGLLTLISFFASATLTPPDPTTQLLAFLAFFPMVLAGSYILTYQLGVELI